MAAATRFALAPCVVALAAGAVRRSAATAGGVFLCFVHHDGRQIAIVPFDLLANQLFDRVDVFGIGFGGDGEGLAGTAGAAGTADAVNIVFGMDWHVVVEDVADVGDVETARRDVGGNQQFQLAVAETGEHLHARSLVHVAMQRTGIELILGQRTEQFGNLDLAVTEDDRVLQVVGLGLDEISQHFALVPWLGSRLHQPLGDVGGRTGGFRNFDPHRRLQELLGELRDFRRHGSREEQRLAGKGNQFADALDIGNEAHVEHTIGLVDDENFHSGQQKLAALEMVQHAAGRRDQHISAALELLFLLVERYAADQQSDVELVVLAVADEVFFHLGGQFAGRLKDERARHACPRATLFEACDHRQHERCRLAGAGLGDTQHVLAEQRMWNSACLDRRRLGVAGIGDCGKDLRRKA